MSGSSGFSMTRKKGKLKFEKAEILLIARSYQVHPGNFEEIISEIKENMSQLPKNVQEFYQKEDKRKIKQRIREKITRLMKARNEETDCEIRKELDGIFEIERKGCAASSDDKETTIQPSSSSSEVASATKRKHKTKQNQESGTSSGTDNEEDERDIRINWARKQAKMIETFTEKDKDKTEKKKKKTGKSSKEQLRENISMQNSFLKYMTKHKREILNISTDSDSDSNE